jgi:type I restriction enzyme R subunit
MSSQFTFLEAEFSDVFDLAEWAEEHALSDPGPAMIYARKALESMVTWAFRHDRSLRMPYEDNLNALLHEPTFKALHGGNLFKAARRVQKVGNRAAHDTKAPSRADAVEVMSALYRVSVWFGHTYGRAAKPDPSVRFDPDLLPDKRGLARRTRKERKQLEERLDREVAEAGEAKAALAAAEHTLAELEAAHAALVAEVAVAKKDAEQSVPEEAFDWSEYETRRWKIDHLLAEAGWALTENRDREFPVTGMPTESGEGFADYVLWGDNALPLAVVEAKKTLTDPQTGKQQAKLYADCLEQMTGQRPVTFYTNGYEHWLWDDQRYPAREVQGFLTKDEIALAIQRRTTLQRLSTLGVNAAIAGRPYQESAIRAIAEHFDNDNQRKALLVMATGSGKTRTTIALVDLLMRANWVKRVLFLADRTALVKQTVNAFKARLPDIDPINLVTDANEDGRVYVSTYQTMVGKIDEYRADGTRRFGVGHFDLVVIDEAHRSVYRKYRSIFEYFDSLLVGLTATPKDEVDKNTYDLFELETSVPTDAYSLDDAIKDGWLVPPRGVSVPLKFAREGIRYNDLSEDEKDQWDELDWGEDDEGYDVDPPDAVTAAALNKFLFNTDTVDKVLEHLMAEGIKVAGGDRLGKTIIFAKNQRHADFIAQRFDANYPQYKGEFARVITHSVNYAQSLIEKFEIAESPPHIAISVDMLDTGIDVPEVVNLVFFKLVRSKTKFWQMLGRGTRLRADLFGPGDDKTNFKVFDFCQNLEYFSQNLQPAEPSGGVPLKEQIFKTRLDLIQAFDALGTDRPARDLIVGDLVIALDSMNPSNFLVRPHLRLVEKFKDPSAWTTVSITDLADLANRVAKLPDQLDPEHADAKRFDVLVLNAQLALLRGEPFEAQRQRIVQVASALEDQQTIPAIAAELALIHDIQTDEWWVDSTYGMLEEVRKKLRLLAPLIERSKKPILYTSFHEPEAGPAVEVELPGTGGLNDSREFVQFRKKAETFLKHHLGEAAIAKVRSGDPLTAADIAELQRILVAAGIGDDATFAEASRRAGSFGLFIRLLVGLDRAAAKAAFADFLDDKRYSRNQITFVNLVIDELTERGLVEARRVYESPYDGLAPEGPEAMFVEADLDRLFAALRTFVDNAGAGA